jgi:hypothetical protein
MVFQLYVLFWTVCGPGLQAGPQRVHASKNNAVHSQQHTLTQLYSATLVLQQKVLPEDDPAGSKHVGVCYNWW